jgi:hypothetical protein
MARKVKCALTKETGTTDTFYKAENGKYYKSQQVYNDWKTDADKRLLARDMLLAYLGWQAGEPYPTLLGKKLKELDFYPGQTICDTINKCSSSIDWAMKNKQFSSTAAKIHYIFAVISNHIGDIHREVKQNQLLKTANEKLADRYISEEIHAKPKVKDLSAWLGEDDDL